MKKKFNLRHIAGFVVLATIISAFAFFNSGCRKNNECTAIITVNDTLGKPANAANVTLYYKDPQSLKTSISSTQTTDASGQATFVFKLQAIFDIDVAWGGKNYVKVGIVKLEPGQTVSQTVNL